MNEENLRTPENEDGFLSGLDHDDVDGPALLAKAARDEEAAMEQARQAQMRHERNVEARRHMEVRGLLARFPEAAKAGSLPKEVWAIANRRGVSLADAYEQYTYNSFAMGFDED